jgi:hypothetical protein
MSVYESEELVNEKSSVIFPVYQKTILNPVDLNGSYDFTVSGGQPITFEFPSGALALNNHSSLRFSITVTTPATANAMVLLHNLPSFFSNFVIRTRGNVVINDSRNNCEFQKYAQMRYRTIDELRSETRLPYSDMIAAVANNQYITGIYTLDIGSTAETVPVSVFKNSVPGVALTPTISYDATRTNGIKYMTQTPKNATATAITYIFNYEVPLSYFKASIFEIKKLIYLPEILQLVLYPQSLSKIGFTDTTATGADWTSTLPVALVAGNVKMSNVSLRCSYCVSPQIVQRLRDETMSSGIDYSFPQLYSYQQSFSDTNTGNVSCAIRLNRSNGESVRQIIFIPYNTSSGPAVCYDNINIGGDKLSKYKFYINSNPTSQYDIEFSDANKNDGWMEMRTYLQNTCFVDNNNYLLNFGAELNLTEEKPFKQPDWDVQEGYSLESESEFRMNFTKSPTPFNMFVFAICNRTLRISASGMQIL